MNQSNLFYAQSGGVTAVINATACGVIETARQSQAIGTVFAGRNGIIGALREELIDTRFESAADIRALLHTPSGAFGSCRYKLKDPAQYPEQFARLLEVFKAHHIRYFLYNGGGDSQDTTLKIAQYSHDQGYPLVCIGIPKTVDNDLLLTDNCPGFGSAAKYVAVSIREAGMDVAAMAETSTKVFILEVMGRHTGWIAAAAGLASTHTGEAPHIILFPEITFDPDTFLAKVKTAVDQFGYCAIVAAEGIRDSEGHFLAQKGIKDAFGHTQLGGVAPTIAQLIKNRLGYKYHWALSDYLQRAARHIASQTDVDQAYAMGRAAVEFALSGKNAVMPVIKRLMGSEYRWIIDEAPLNQVANSEKVLPRNYISEDGFSITQACRAYLLPLIQGEAYPPYKNGLPDYVKLRNQLVEKKCAVVEQL